MGSLGSNDWPLVVAALQPEQDPMIGSSRACVQATTKRLQDCQRPAGWPCLNSRLHLVALSRCRRWVAWCVAVHQM